MRPVAARWFEALVARDDMTHAMEQLADTGLIQLEPGVPTRPETSLRDLQGLYQEYHELRQRDGGYWPVTGIRPGTSHGRPATTYARALEQLRAWRTDNDGLIQTLEARRRERTWYRHVLTWLKHIQGGAALALGELHRIGPWLDYRLVLCPPECDVDFDCDDLLLLNAPVEPDIYRLVVGNRDRLTQLDTQLLQTEVMQLRLPGWLNGRPPQAITTLQRRLDEVDQELRRLQAALEASHATTGLQAALGDIERLNWFMQHIEYHLESDRLAWVRGWTIADSAEALQQALAHEGARGLVHFAPPPEGVEPPLTLRHSGWSRAFELFPRLLGMPGRDEYDPTNLLAWVVPLLFGYMFGDVGQGLVILLAGVLLRRRIPQLALLIPAGASAMIFGLLYGSLFSIEGLIPALWLHPMQHPLLLLGIPLAGGALLLLTGLVLAGVQAGWAGRRRHWWLGQAPVIVLYLGLPLLFVAPLPAQALLLGGLAWYLGGHARLTPARPLRGALIALAELVESLFQLVINTLSFARVGAFALAHAALSQAVMALMEISTSLPATALVFLLGNLLILVLEGLVVSIQTTRLVLFEFFIRFLRSTGRGFVPLPAPGYDRLRPVVD
ncbi:V-type ATP synthase subunit I [Thiohalobacter thiocyanaticus]|uniref:ATPase n=1 Tax=Thiohalobacter thiocyanaticus TaxID=585455 RepID=A0A426QE32_9GAMM|nr:ATPase [Thiohalobacter thiocyanaticus]RRQ20006.1 ATPase [Thiohalobacter thiocyanaticus]